VQKNDRRVIPVACLHEGKSVSKVPRSLRLRNA
jgi:hypothetical protein